MKVLQDKKQAQKLTHMTSFSTRINGVTYHDLVEALGKPLYNPEDSGDGKTNYEWVVLFEGNVFTIYDWKTYDEIYSMNELTSWHIGSKAGVLEVDRFVRHLETIVTQQMVIDNPYELSKS
jgi:hypothetical protein